MPQHVNDVKSKLSYLNANVNALDLMMEFERTLDNANVYAYKNWMCGEIVDGPNIDRYWVTVKIMYPHTLMPDPRGGQRLEKFGCKVSYEKDLLEVPVNIEPPKNAERTARKHAKMVKRKVWIVTIVMPRRYLDERILDGIAQDEASATVNIDDINDAYDASEEMGDEEMGDFTGTSEADERDEAMDAIDDNFGDLGGAN